MKRCVMVLSMLLVFAVGIAHADDSTFVRVTKVDGLWAKDTLKAGDTAKFHVMFGNRSSKNYNLTNGFKIYSRASLTSGDIGSGTAQWPAVQPAVGTPWAYRFPATAGGNTGPLVDTTSYLKKSNFLALFRFNCFSCNGQGSDTVGFGAAASDLDQTAMAPYDSGVAMIFKVVTRKADHGKVICFDSTATFPPSLTWKWAPFNQLPGTPNAFPDWNGPFCYVLFDSAAPKNQAPVLNPIGSQSVDENQNLTIIATATDPDGTTPTLSASPLPTGASFIDNGNGTGTLSWTPSYSQAGVYNVQFSASDGELTDVEMVAITVKNVNRPPTLDPIGAKAVAEAANLNFGVSGSDPDGGTLSFSATPLPAGATFTDHLNNTATFDWTPNYNQAGDYNVLVVVSDGGMADSEMVSITVTNVNRPPVLAAIGAKNVMVGEVLAFNISASDPDATALTLSASPLTHATFTDNGNGTGAFSFAPTPDQVGDQSVTFTVSDGSLSDDEVVTITVIPRANFLVLTPSSLNFVTTFGTPAPIDSFKVEKGGDTEIDYTASKTATWINLTNATGTTPAYVGVSATGMPVGDYKDSVKVSGTGVGDKYVVVTLKVNPCPVIQLSRTSYYDTVFVGENGFAADSVHVTSTGAPLHFAAQPSAGFAFPISEGTTPGNFIFVFNELFTAAGTYQRCFTVVGGSQIPEDPCTSETQVCVNIVVQEKPCVTLKVSDSLLQFTAVHGDEIAAPFARQFMVTSSDPERNFAFDVSAPEGVNWIVFDTTGVPGPLAGTTPRIVSVQVRPASLSVGTHFADITVSSAAGEVCQPKSKVLTVSVTIVRRPSADTVLVENKPAVPGQTVMVPINFVNSCPVQSLHAILKYNAAALHLAGVSYGDSRINYLTARTEVIDNGAGTVMLMADAGSQDKVPTGFGNWANLIFVVRPEANAGFYPVVLDNCDCTNILFIRDCGQGLEEQTPEFVGGGVMVDRLANSVCGYVVDPEGTEIPGATVQLWANFPQGSPEMTTTSSSIGSFFFNGVTSVPFDLYAYADGYYPGKLEDLNFEAKGIKIVLTPLGRPTPTSQWVDYYCDQNTYLQAPLPVGSVVEARTSADLLVGQFVVVAAGKYGFMPVYRASSQFGDDGAVAGDNIKFYVNGIQALTTGNTEYPGDYAKVQVCLEYGATITQTCQLQEGWNLVSWPVQTKSKEVLTVLGPYMNCIDVILGFEQGGLTYDPTLPDFSTLWDVDHFSGYWIKVKQGCPVTLEIEGLPVPMNTPIPVTTGWNLVSYLPKWNLTPGYALQSIYPNLLFAYGWENGIQIFKPGSEFSTLTSMKPCNGYWVKITTDDTLIYPDQDVAAGWMAPRIAGAVQSLSNGDYTTPTWVNLYATNLKLDGQTVGTGSVIEAYSVDGDAKVGSFTMKTDGKFGFMPVYADTESPNLQPGGKFYLSIDGTRTRESFTWTANGDRTMVSSLSTGNSIGSLPTGFSLEQNYPNPFNPTTTISFSVPVNTRARIEIYNVLGALIAVPFDDAVQAGEHQVVWDGRNQNGETVASGVYLYKLVSDSYSEARKMMLLK
ncbi:MAG: cadherin-like domain-containing protein [candidate division Zixibacteria bacterium]|nr:cadherin-like domain-containing protein [candidate division Zixibacteria bacterium]